MAERRFTLEAKEVHHGQEHPDVAKVQKYLTRFGYLTTTIEPGRLDQPTSDALRSFQHVYGVEETGYLDPATQEALEQPRCGVPDVPTVAATHRGESAEFVLRGCSYSRLALTYRFTNGTGDITGDDERAAVQRAFNTWASVLRGVSFTLTTAASADFTIGWFTGAHGDGSAFDGVGNTLAHAFYPPPCGGANAGALHYDDAETWGLAHSPQRFDTETVALHEIGHLLGLDHSTVAGAVMFASYGGERRQLTQDDIDGIRRLYPALVRRGDSGAQAGFVGEIAAVAPPRGRRLVTAVRTQASTLKLIAWESRTDGSLLRTADSGDQAGAARSIDIALAGPDEMVTAVRTSAGKLKLIGWDVANDGSGIQRHGDSGEQAGTADLIKIEQVGSALWATACRDGSGNLKVITWTRRPDESFERRADSGSQAGEIRDLDMAVVDNGLLLTAVRTASDTLKLILWRVTENAVQRLGDSGEQAGDSRFVKVTMDPHGNAVTAVRAANASLKLITWRVRVSGVIQRLSDSGNLAGTSNGHDLGPAPGGRLATAVVTEDGNLKVIAWETRADGTVTRHGDSGNQAGAATLPTLVLPRGDDLVTAVRAANSSLKLISWGF